ncbi:hypothetical protein CLIB1444_02S00386 [[Candida] jaroonii]|uniref:Uncharacterized protein n=1 Tax=[Candida] jaroonii TaxID=467808 RepID=A0ACA9Y288_9ASCO|nr:hypothetical protein CLIB1444_02S00386 [[Candida] jaroonii]
MDDNIDPKELSNIYKKNGTFDRQRKQLLDNFKSSMTHTNLLLKLKIMVENKVKQDPSILTKNKGKMAALIQGEILGSGKEDDSFLSIVDKDIQEKLIDSPEFHNLIKTDLKDIKRKKLGISDEEFAKQLEEENKLEKIKLAEKERNNIKKHKINKPPKVMIRDRNNYRRPTSSNNRTNNSSKDYHLMY